MYIVLILFVFMKSPMTLDNKETSIKFNQLITLIFTFLWKLAASPSSSQLNFFTRLGIVPTGHITLLLLACPVSAGPDCVAPGTVGGWGASFCFDLSELNWLLLASDEGELKIVRNKKIISSGNLLLFLMYTTNIDFADRHSLLLSQALNKFYPKESNLFYNT